MIRNITQVMTIVAVLSLSGRPTLSWQSFLLAACCVALLAQGYLDGIDAERARMRGER